MDAIVVAVDLVLGMFLPFTIAVSLMVAASASVFYYGDAPFAGSKITPRAAAEIFAEPGRLGETVGLWIFGLGILAMALSSITMQMLASGFAGVKLFGFKEHSNGHKLFTVLPAVGVLGAIWWSELAAWVPVPTNIICGIFLPLSYLGFLILNLRKDYLGADRPGVTTSAMWSIGMILAIAAITAGLVSVLVLQLPTFLEKFGGA